MDSPTESEDRWHMLQQAKIHWKLTEIAFVLIKNPLYFMKTFSLFCILVYIFFFISKSIWGFCIFIILIQ